MSWNYGVFVSLKLLNTTMKTVGGWIGHNRKPAYSNSFEEKAYDFPILDFEPIVGTFYDTLIAVTLNANVTFTQANVAEDGTIIWNVQ